mmetsp:Transcript_5223/g.10174  ORF Transcript_5223/g.10174 Transcript_5223/m.10174 type:complete len:506 (+) Transcript_5223:133-1650(+)
MPPKKKPPSQAGKFKPLKRPTRKSLSAPSSAAASASSSATAGERGRSSLDGRTATAGRGGDGPSGRGGGRGGGRSRGGRDGRGRGRGRGRGGRFIVPTGAAFFTGESIGSQQPGVGSGVSMSIGGASHEMPRENVKMGAGTDGAVFMPGSSGRASMAMGGAGGIGGPDGRVARSAAESMAAAARAKAGEGEEIIVAEMMDLEADDDDDEAGKKKSVLDGPSRSGLPSLFDDEDQKQESTMEHGVSDAFLYDSDSSAEERKSRRRKMQGGNGDFRMPPSQLPFPISSNQTSMYDCQEVTDDDEKKMSDADAQAAVTTTTVKLSDPPFHSPFLDLESVSEELKQIETSSWFVMKFPTRLPHLDTSSSSASAAVAIESDLTEESGAVPDAAKSSNNITADGVGSMASSAPSSSLPSESGQMGYDDTLKDSAPGRYGRIEIRRSGKTELVLGGGDLGPEVRMPIHQGLQCGFRQEAVCIDPNEATFVALGDVDKSLIVTPDVERAFVFS